MCGIVVELASGPLSPVEVRRGVTKRVVKRVARQHPRDLVVVRREVGFRDPPPGPHRDFTAAGIPDVPRSEHEGWGEDVAA